MSPARRLTVLFGICVASTALVMLSPTSAIAAPHGAYRQSQDFAAYHTGSTSLTGLIIAGAILGILTVMVLIGSRVTRRRVPLHGAV